MLTSLCVDGTSTISATEWRCLCCRVRVKRLPIKCVVSDKIGKALDLVYSEYEIFPVRCLLWLLLLAVLVVLYSSTL